MAIPSLCNEAFCLVALESLCYRKACIATNAGALSEVLDDKCAIMLDLGDNYITNLAKGIIRLYEDCEFRKELEHNALEKTTRFPDSSQYFDNFNKLINCLMECM